LAALNHPNIAHVYGLEESANRRCIVMELVAGETLQKRLSRGAIPVEEAVPIAKQIAEALEAAHERGIIHRDLKPGNIMLTSDGSVKVLDFGLAKAFQGQQPSDLPNSPTFVSAASMSGVILGTAPYMSPEQARGKPVDKRTDIWAFGCVLFEMLTGRPAFGGEIMADILAAVVAREPDWSALPESATPILPFLKRSLEKDPKRRLRDIGDVSIVLIDAVNGSVRALSPILPRAESRRLRWWIAAAGLIFSLGVVLSLRYLSPARSTSFPVTRTTVVMPTNTDLYTFPAATLALSADGSRLAFVARHEGHIQLYVRDLASFDAKVVDDSERAQHPFFSADGHSVAFFADGKLKRASVYGGAPSPICDVPIVGRGGTWGSDGTIVFSTGPTGLMRVTASGGQPTPLTSKDPSMDSRFLAWPEFLPDSEGLLVTVEGQNPNIAVLDLKTREWKVLGPGSQPHYLSPGYLVYHAPHIREGELDVVPFDLGKLAIHGTPVAVVDRIFRAANGGAASFAVSQTGILAFAPGGFARTLVSVDQQGRRTPLVSERRGFRFPRSSPDGRKVAVTIDPRPSQIWVYDIERQSQLRISSEGHSLMPVWTADGKRVTYSYRNDMYWRSADGSSAEQVLLARDNIEYATSWSPDGRFLLFQSQDPVTQFNIWLLPVEGSPRPLLATKANEMGGRFSPDGRWLTYQSDESGRSEIYVRPFPKVDEQRWTISNGGGNSPVWSHDGHQIFYMNGTVMMAVSIQAGERSFLASKPQFLFDGPFDATQTFNFDVLPDGKHFIMVEADPDATPTQLQVVTNWFEELKHRVPVN
jgi:serine/threonine-protein kinase